MPFLVANEVLARAKRLELPWNKHGLDPYGASQVEVARLFTVLGFLYRRYFRVRVTGIEHVPGRGRAMLIGNHSGGWAVDALMVMAAAFFEMEPPRLAQGMIEKFLARIPFSGMNAAATGHLVGLP